MKGTFRTTRVARRRFEEKPSTPRGRREGLARERRPLSEQAAKDVTSKTTSAAAPATASAQLMPNTEKSSIIARLTRETPLKEIDPRSKAGDAPAPTVKSRPPATLGNFGFTGNQRGAGFNSPRGSRRPALEIKPAFDGQRA